MSEDEITKILGERIVEQIKDATMRAYSIAGPCHREAVISLLQMMLAATMLPDADDETFPTEVDRICADLRSICLAADAGRKKEKTH
ncbi:MAG: hypothetical protein JSS20_22155 [Proteobacteria bacterium]|nr:hypothetical protein [Pseudomonadota bacterium]